MEFQNVRSYKRKRRLSDSHSKLPCNVQTNIQSLFEKQFSYEASPCSDYSLESCGEIKLHEEWIIKENIAMKNELNSLKNNLNDKDMLTWHDHTREVNLAGNIASEIRNRVRPELCTQAWCKFYEIASRYINLEKLETFFSVHLCEAPGAFITSFNHFLYTHDYSENWQWLATTLNPYYEGNSIGHMIDEDRFIRSSHDNWYFGEDGTGDLMSEANLVGLKRRLSQYEVNLVTADGSIDCQGDPAEQENVVSRLQHCEVFTALHILSPGGTLVVKMFTLFECKAVSMMYLLNCVFEKVEVFKPCTSKGGNSEVYVIGLEYKGRQSCNDFLKVMTPIYFGSIDIQGCLFSMDDIPHLFLDQHSKCIEFFKDCQMTAIQRNLDLLKVMSDEERTRLEVEKDYCAECFFNRYVMKPLASYARIMNIQKERKSNVGRKSEFAVKTKLEGKFTGSFHERLELSTLPWQQKLKTFETYDDIACREDNSLWIHCPNGVMSETEICKLHKSLGKQVSAIHSSRFCDGFYVARTRDIIENVKWLSLPYVVDKELVKRITTKLRETLDATIQYYRMGNTQYEITNLADPQSVCSTSPCTPCGHVILSAASCRNCVNTTGHDSCTCDGERTDDIGSQKHETIQCDDNSNGCNKCIHSESDDLVSVGSDNNRPCVQHCSAKSTKVCSTNQQAEDRNCDSSCNTCGDSVTTDSKEHRRSLMKFTKLRSDSAVLNKLCLEVDMNVDGVTVGLYSVTTDTVSSRFELDQHRKLISVVIHILKNCKTGDYAVIEMGSCLSRFTAGLVYILYRCFKEVGFIHHHGYLLNRHMVCVGYLHCPMKLLQYLEHVDHMITESQSDAMLEIVPILTLIDDSEFSSFLRISNVNLLQSFITTVVKREKLVLSGENNEDT